MSSVYTPILVGVVSMVSEILLLSKMAKFPFRGMDYSPWSSKNLIDRNWLKKFMQIWIDIKCMYTNFGGCGLSDFGDIATFKNGQIFLLGHGLCPWSSKNLIGRNWLKKFMQVWIDIKCIHTNFGGCGLFAFEDIATFKNGQISLLGRGLYSPWSSKNLIDRNWLKKFMQIWIDVKCIHTNFGGCGLSAFGGIATFKNDQISLSGHGHQKNYNL